MKKVGLAVCYDTKNFGSQLQVLATIKKVEDLEYETEIIRYKKKVTPTFIVQTIPRLFNVSFVKAKLAAKDKNKKITQHPEIAKMVATRNKRFQMFVTEHFTNLSKAYCGWENLVKESKENYDMFLCGSDQLWLPNNLGSHFYTLEFAPNNKPKIAYATSFGQSSLPKDYTKKAEVFLKKIKHIGVREESGQKLVKEIANRDVPVVCDPTLLFTGDEWMAIQQKEPIVKGKYIL